MKGLVITFFIISCIAACWAFSDWCEAQIKIEQERTMQHMYDAFGNSYKANAAIANKLKNIHGES